MKKNLQKLFFNVLDRRRIDLMTPALWNADKNKLFYFTLFLLIKIKFKFVVESE